MRFVLASFAVCALACGGAIGPIDPNSLELEGSYDLVVSDVEAHPDPEYPQPPVSPPPAVGQHARLDIERRGTTFEAAITTDYGDAEPFTVSLEGGALTLSGRVSFLGPSTYGSASADLEQLVLPIGAGGKLSGSFTATGAQNLYEGDVGWSSPATASGSFGPDARAPEVLGSVAATAGDAALPWDTLSVRVSEPVADAATLRGALGLVSASGAVTTRWDVATPAFDWLGVTSASGYRMSWSDFHGDAVLGVAGGLANPSGNLSATASTPTRWLNVPTATAFDAATPPATWGAAALANTPASCGTASGCIELGPVTGPCGVASAGLAGRFPASGATKLSITFRVRAASQYGTPHGTALGVNVATPGSPAQSLYDPALSPELSATDDATYGWASDWTTAEVPVPQSGSELGVSITPFGSGSTYCGGGPAIPPVTLVVDVAEVKPMP